MTPSENLLHQMTQEVIHHIGSKNFEVALKKLKETRYYMLQLMDYATTDDALIHLKKHEILLDTLEQKIP